MNFNDENYQRLAKAAGNLEKNNGDEKSADEFRLALDGIVNLNALNEQGNSMMHIAAYKGQAFVLSELINAGADINIENEKHGVRPLHLAIVKNSFGCVNELLKMGADVNAKGSKGQTPLHTTLNVPCAKALLDAGAEIDARSNSGATPCMSQRRTACRK
ncbi:ankyrin repeat domain-containing protein [Stenotrophomonas maltophilia]|uniref:ankyrin repeat domain-containing protein n=1 Tax=Stenotrophomonas maltophilia TaxID=40324 RepID=UPI00131227B1|nr:ankyrin repeat domain-containing protein [Stenotrophomonas maltophilia]MCO7499951.1 ankyrin repeat domain-containing protein [Stenotrophomonas maltophilia]